MQIGSKDKNAATEVKAQERPETQCPRPTRFDPEWLQMQYEIIDILRKNGLTVEMAMNVLDSTRQRIRQIAKV